MNKAVMRFIAIWLINSIVIYLVSSTYPADVVLGTYNMSMALSALVAGGVLTLIARVIKRLDVPSKVKALKGRYAMFVFWWLANSLGVWIVARLAPVTGMGISSYYWALILGFALSLIQWLVRQALKARKLL